MAERRYIVRPLAKGRWQCTDTATSLSITWQEGHFNETQDIDYTHMVDDPIGASRAAVAMTDWLVRYRGDLLVPQDDAVKQIKRDARRDVGIQIREVRELLGWSVDDLAQESGVGRSIIFRIESGRANTSIDTLALLADAMKTQFMI